MAIKKTVSITEEQEEFLEEHNISPSGVLQDAIEDRREQYGDI